MIELIIFGLGAKILYELMNGGRTTQMPPKTVEPSRHKEDEMLIAIKDSRLLHLKKTAERINDMEAAKYEFVAERPDGAILEYHLDAPAWDKHGRVISSLKETICCAACGERVHQASARECAYCHNEFCRQHLVSTPSGKFLCHAHAQEAIEMVPDAKGKLIGYDGKPFEP